MEDGGRGGDGDVAPDPSTTRGVSCCLPSDLKSCIFLLYSLAVNRKAEPAVMNSSQEASTQYHKYRNPNS